MKKKRKGKPSGPVLPDGNGMEAYFAGGCFWCMAKPYHTVEGVTSVVSGYCGGSEEDPTYEQVKGQKTGHRETVKITFDPEVLSYAELLQVYFYNIDPFDGGGQYIDRGHSYTCAIYWTDAEQKAQAEKAVRTVAGEYGKEVCVSVEPLLRFYPAEEYHQDYAEKNAEAYAKEYEESGRAAVKDTDRVFLRND